MHDHAHNGIHLAEHVGGRHPERHQPLLCQPPVPPFVARRIIAPIMGGAIHLDRKAGPVAEEVEHIGPQRMLVPELESAGPGSKLPPEQHLGKAHPPAKPARAMNGHARTLAARNTHPKSAFPDSARTPPPPFGRSPSPAKAGED
jgi:hypothetical protein